MKRQPCEIFSRIVGYIRPIRQWNPGKISELRDRKMFDWKKEFDKKIASKES